MDVGQGPATRTFLLDPGCAGRFAQHPALSNKDNVAVRELLLELSRQPNSIPTQTPYVENLVCVKLTFVGFYGMPSTAGQGRKLRWPFFHLGHQPHEQQISGEDEAQILALGHCSPDQ